MPANKIKKRICTEILAIGPNKGMRCCDVNKYCKITKHKEKNVEINTHNSNNNNTFSNNTNSTIITDTNVNINNGDINNNMINIICIGERDDFNKILSQKIGQENAKTYILNCAKNDLEGDVNLLKKIYFEGLEEKDYPIRFIDRARTKVEFRNQLGKKVVDPHGFEISKRLCTSLQNSYLMHVTEILEAHLDQQEDGNFLDEFDIMKCQNHIYNLSSHTYRRKVLKYIPQ